MSPNRKLPPKYHPPSLADRLLSHWADFAIILLGFKQGVLALLDTLSVGRVALGLPSWQGFAVAGFMLVGSALSFFAMLYHFNTLANMLKWQRLGLGFMGLAWIGLLIVAGLAPHVVLASSPWTTAVVGAVAVWGLFWLTWVYEDRIHASATETPT